MIIQINVILGRGNIVNYKTRYSKIASKCKYFSSINSNYDTSHSYSNSYKQSSCYNCVNFISQHCTLNNTDIVDDEEYF